MRLIIAGGGTGGHIFPALAIAEEFEAQGTDNQALFIGARAGLEAELLKDKNVKLIRGGKFSGMGRLNKIKGLGESLIGVFQAISIIREFKPQVILGVGGYVSVPVVIAGFLMRKKIAIQEQNSYPGLANRFLALLSDRVFLSFAPAKKFFRFTKEGKFIVAGNPLRRKLVEELKSNETEDKKGNSTFRILVVGGSQGAKRLNQLMMEALAYLEEIREKIKVVHMTGAHLSEELKQAYRQKRVKAEVKKFIEDIGKEFKQADLVISRSGAGAIFELAMAGKPGILIPYPYSANQHQVLNARYLTDQGAGLMFLEKDLDAKKLADAILQLFEHPEQRAEMGKKARSLAIPEASKTIVEEIIRMGVAGR